MPAASAGDPVQHRSGPVRVAPRPRNRTRARRVASPVAGSAQTLARVDEVLARTLDKLSRWDVDALLPSPEEADPAATRNGRAGQVRVDLVEMLRERLGGGGKRLRPVFAHWGWVATDGPGQPGTDQVLAAIGAALELLHLFALVQDDVMDRSDTRRGSPTVHVAAADLHRRRGGLGDPLLFGDTVATLLGDLALAEATLLVADAPEPVRSLWQLMTVELVHGQLWDVTQAASRHRPLRVSSAIARLKTGRYTVTRPLQLGALVAGADPQLVAQLGRYGDLVGDAFALRDDILGVWGDPVTTGKPAGDDLRSAKPTVLLALGAECAPPAGRELIDRCTEGTLDDTGVAQLRQALVDWGVLAQVEAMIDRLVAEAGQRLAVLPVRQSAREALDQLAALAAWRQS